MILSDGDAGNILSVLFWSVVAIGLGVGGFFAVTWLKRKMAEDDTSAPGEGGFSLSELRELHAEGKITRQEFEKAKYAIVEAAKAAGEARAHAAAEARAATKPPANRSSSKGRGSFL